MKTFNLIKHQIMLVFSDINILLLPTMQLLKLNELLKNKGIHEYVTSKPKSLDLPIIG